MLRALVEEDGFDRAFAKIQPDAKKRDAIMSALHSALPMHPEKGISAPGTDKMVLAAKRYSKPQFLIVYSYDASKVYLHTVIPIVALDQKQSEG